VAKSPINVTISGDYNDRDIKKAIRDLQSLTKESDSSESRFSKLGKSAIGMGAAFGIGFAGVQGLANAFRDSIAEAQEAIKVNAATEQIIKSTGAAANVTAEQVADLSQRLSEQIAVDDELIQTSANLVLTFKNIKNEGSGLAAVFDRTVLAAQDLAAAGFGDAESAAKMLGKALNDPERGLTALGRAGVTFTQQQKDQIKVLTEGGDVLAAQQVILGEVESQVGGVAGATATGIDRFNVYFANLKEEIGLALLPFINALINGVIPAISAVSNLVRNSSKFFEENKTAIVLATTAVIALTASMLANRIGGVAFAIQYGINTAVTGAYTVAANAARIATIALMGAMKAIPFVAIATAVVGLVTALDQGAKSQEAWRKEQENTLRATNNLRDETGNFTKEAVALGVASRFAHLSQRDLNGSISGTVGAAIAAGNEIEVLTKKTWGAADAAFGAYKEFIKFAQVAANTTKATADQAERGIEAANSLDTLAGATDRATGSSRSAADAVEKLKVKWQEATALITEDVTGLALTIRGKTQQISGDLVDNFQNKLEAFRGVVAEQTSIINAAQGTLDAYAQSVSDTILGKLNFATADATGTPLTPEQIVNLMLGDTAEQQGAVTALANSGLMTQLPEALAQKILNLPATAAVGLVNYLTQNPEALAKLTENYQKLATDSLTLLGIPMANAFAEIGDVSAVAMIADAQKAIKKSAAAFTKFVKDQLGTTITIDVKYNYINPPGGTPSIEGRATGGPVSRGTPYVVGERGPELFVPDIGGTIIPNGGGGGGSAPGGGIVVNVNAGMGTDGVQVGQQIVEALRAYQRRNGALPIKVAL
jgi:hypothetical protein